MTKPLLLIVDDDQAVLEALEAELRPAFGESCRIETYDRPQDVLDSLPRWREQGTPIALAIVDQKMPGLTGIELLSRFREEARRSESETAARRPASQKGVGSPAAHPASGARTVLLTGYGGPEVARAAREQAGADRYREKPWSGAELARDVGELLQEFWLTARAGERQSGSGTAVGSLRTDISTRGPLGEDRLLVARLNEALADEEPGFEPPALETLLAFVHDQATEHQRSEVLEASLRSSRFRRALVELLEDLRWVSSPEARAAYDRTRAPSRYRGPGEQA